MMKMRTAGPIHNELLCTRAGQQKRQHNCINCTCSRSTCKLLISVLVVTRVSFHAVHNILDISSPSPSLSNGGNLSVRLKLTRTKFYRTWCPWLSFTAMPGQIGHLLSESFCPSVVTLKLGYRFLT